VVQCSFLHAMQSAGAQARGGIVKSEESLTASAAARRSRRAPCMQVARLMNSFGRTARSRCRFCGRALAQYRALGGPKLSSHPETTEKPPGPIDRAGGASAATAATRGRHALLAGNG
jgi:hypothetical protein